MTKDSRVVHDCPLLEYPHITGFSYDDYVVDILHGWVLGGVSSIVGKSIMFCVKSWVFTPASVYLDSDDRDRLAMLHIKSLLGVYYEAKKKNDPKWRITGTEVATSKATSGQGLYEALEGLIRPWTAL
jgi:hypothetical protein